MIDPVNEFENHVAARLLDFFGNRTAWHRKLWNIGLMLTLQEVSEAISAVRAGVLSEAALGFLANSAHKTVGTDPGAGTPERRQVIQSALRGKHSVDGLDHTVIVQAEAALRSQYLAQLASAPHAGVGPRLRAHPRADAPAAARPLTEVLGARGGRLPGVSGGARLAARTRPVSSVVHQSTRQRRARTWPAPRASRRREE